MKSNIVILLIMAAYFTLATIAYGIWSVLYLGYLEPIGTAAIGLLIILSVFIAFYLYSGMRRSATLPEDRLDGNIEDESGAVGFFAPWSWWPLAIGASAAVAFLGLAVGWWVFFIALPLAVVAIVGFVYGHDRFAHAH